VIHRHQYAANVCDCPRLQWLQFGSRPQPLSQCSPHHLSRISKRYSASEFPCWYCIALWWMRDVLAQSLPVAGRRVWFVENTWCVHCCRSSVQCRPNGPVCGREKNRNISPVVSVCAETLESSSQRSPKSKQADPRIDLFGVELRTVSLYAAGGGSRSSRRRILPTFVFGSSVRNSTNFGCL
jgi:hypothetical protein